MGNALVFVQRAFGSGTHMAVGISLLNIMTVGMPNSGELTGPSQSRTLKWGGDDWPVVVVRLLFMSGCVD
jgi:hypothetical protein